MRAYYWRLLMFAASFSCFSNDLPAQFLKDTYRFNGVLSVSAPDCGPDLIPAIAPGNCTPVYANGGYFINEMLPHCGAARTVYHNNLNWGLKYLNTPGTISSTYTISLYLKTTNWGSRPWVRIIEFSDGVSDNGIYFFKSTASPDRCLQFYPNGIVGTCPYFNDSTWYLLTFTRNGATGMMYVYVNNTLFGSYNDVAGAYTSIPGKPVYIFRDDQQIPCEMGEASFGYLSFMNVFSTQAIVDSVYNDICNISNAPVSANFSVTPNPICQSQVATVRYSGDIPAPGTGFTFNWNWNNATVLSGSGMGPYTVSWNVTGLQTITLNVTNNVCFSQNNDTAEVFVNAPLLSSISTTICEGESFEGYTSGGIYVDTLTSSAGCDSIRTLNLTVKPKSYSTINQTICEGQSYMGYSTTGVYSDILVAANGCDSIRTLNLAVKPKAFSSLNQTICDGQTYLGYNATGIYKDTLPASNGCDSIRTLNLTVLQKPRPDLGPDKEICDGDSLTLSPGSFTSYSWQNGSALPYLIAKQPGIYSVTVTEACGSAIDNVVIKIKDCTPYFPNAFTPNHDGKNDQFRILNGYNLRQYELAIYNRWGQKIFETKDPSIGWSGTFNGRLQNAGVYVWYSAFKRNGIQTNLKGTFTLIR